MKQNATSDISHLLIQCHLGDPSAADQLMPLVYEELRKLAAARIAQERPGLTLQATALVHEAYVRLVKSDSQVTWDSRGHFFAAAAEAMRRIMIDRARRRSAYDTEATESSPTWHWIARPRWRLRIVY